MTISGVLKGFNNTVIYFAEEHSYKEINNVSLIFSYGSRSLHTQSLLPQNVVYVKFKARQGGESKYALKKICVVWYDLDPGVDL